MKKLVEFRVSDHNCFRVKTENENLPLSLFDNIIIEYHSNKKKIIVYKDFLCEGLRCFSVLLEKALNKDLQIQPAYKEKGLGFEWNIACYKLYNDQLYSDEAILRHSLWTNEDVNIYDTWIYNDQSNIYIEMSVTYNWKNEMVQEDNVLFKQFIENYKRLDLVKVAKEEAENCLNECKAILNAALK